METVNQIEYNGALYNVQDPEAQKSLVYSLNETDTGKIWIDGKKIYRKVILLPAIAKDASYQEDLSSLEISAYINFCGMARIADDVFVPLLVSDEQDVAYNTYISFIEKKLNLKNGVKRSILDGYAILEYTKTTN